MDGAERFVVRRAISIKEKKWVVLILLREHSGLFANVISTEMEMISLHIASHYDARLDVSIAREDGLGKTYKM